MPSRLALHSKSQVAADGFERGVLYIAKDGLAGVPRHQSAFVHFKPEHRIKLRTGHSVSVALKPAKAMLGEDRLLA